MGKLSEAQVQDALQRARATGRRLGRFLLQEGLVSADEVCRALSLQSGLPMTDLNRAEVTPELGRLFPFATLEKLVFVPFDESRKLVCIAASDPLSKEMVADLEAACQRKIEVFLAQEELVLAQLDRLRPHSEAEQRWQSRYLASLPVSYQFCNRLGRTMIQKTFQGRTVDVGQGGLLMEGPGPEPLTPDEVRRRGLCLNVTLSLPPLEAKALCGIRAVKGLEHSPSWHWGLQILEMSAEERRILKEICLRVSHKLDEARGAPPAAAPPA